MVLTFRNWLRQLLFRSKPFLYTLAGALGGAAIERVANTFADYWITSRAIFIADIISAVLLFTGGVLFALIAEESDTVDRVVEREADVQDRELAFEAWREGRTITVEMLREQHRDLVDTRDQEERDRFPRVSRLFFLATVLLIITLPGLVIGHKPSAAPQHPVIRFGCNPCIVTAGEPSRLDWDAGEATEAFLNGDRVPIRGSKTVRPERSTTYHLRAVNSDGEAEVAVTVEVQEPPTPTPTPKPPPSLTPADVSGPTRTHVSVD